ncbi:helix-turn-helix domain-containing protein [Spirosoma spitsbergense]|uniref:helix-turn-helix domain-containing protein n=1 Tax=Spirosoma spitsbergense TaxID=431554 RepID=UPI0003693236|nr:helix-turn-helix domain-containing protein [Spirosoma spitsbergense]
MAFRLLPIKSYRQQHKTFADHRHSFYELIYIETGTGVHTIDFVDYPIQNHTLYLLSPGQVHSLQKGHIDAGFVLIFDRDYLTPDQLENQPLMQILVCSRQLPQISLAETDQLHLHYCEMLICDELARTQPDYELIRLTLKIMLIKGLRASHFQIGADSRPTERAKKLFFDFLWLVEESYSHRQEVGYYADKLGVSAKYLTDLTRQINGKSALQLIHDRVLTEGKRLLFYSELSVKEITGQIGFDEASYFSRFFTGKVGFTPKEFQKRNPKYTG